MDLKSGSDPDLEAKPGSPPKSAGTTAFPSGPRLRPRGRRGGFGAAAMEPVADARDGEEEEDVFLVAVDVAQDGFDGVAEQVARDGPESRPYNGAREVEDLEAQGRDGAAHADDEK